MLGKMVIHSVNASRQQCGLELSMYNLCCIRYNGEHCEREKPKLWLLLMAKKLAFCIFLR